MDEDDGGASLKTAGEFARKGVHVAMGGFAFLLRWLTPAQAMACAAAALAFNLFVLHRVTRGSLMRDHERGRGFSLGIVLYPAVVLAAIVAFRDRLEIAAGIWALLAFGDGMATVVGLVVGGPRLPWNRGKTWSGLAAFVFYGGFGAAVLIPWTQRARLDAAAADRVIDWIGTSFLRGQDSGAGTWMAFLLAGCAAAALAAAFAESLDIGVDDNVLVPLVGGATLAAAAAVDPGRLGAETPELLRRLALGLAVNAVVAVAAYRVRGVDRAGAVTGTVLGGLLWAFAGPAGFALLLTFFVLGTAATKLGYAKKAALGIAQEKGGRRGAKNAIANVSAAVAFAFLAIATPYPTLFALATAAAFATAAGDTVSSEIGQAFGRRHVLITSLRRVPAGTDGAVSLEGTLAGLAASTVLAVVGWLVGVYPAWGIAIVAVAGFAGNLLESAVGAAFAGVREIDNEAVNFANTVAGGAIAMLLAIAAWGHLGA